VNTNKTVAERERSDGGLAEALQDFSAEFVRCWKQLPNKGLFWGLLSAWLVLFQVLGSSTMGYVVTPSLFGWMLNAYGKVGSGDSHGALIPLVVLVLLWWKRKELLRLPNAAWWPGLLVLAFALGLHVCGYLVQEARVSIVALFVGIYGIMGISWGRPWLRATFFPFVLFAFCVPIGSLTEQISFPLRLLVTKIVTTICPALLGIEVNRVGTHLFSPDGKFEYEIAAACSGIRSLIATVAIAVIYGFLSFPSWWKRLLLVLSAFPLAVLGNVFRMLTIVIAAEIGGQEAGSYVHEGGPLGILSLLPYVPAIGGLLLLGRWMEGTKPRSAPQPAEAAT
jgi:exosortase